MARGALPTARAGQDPPAHEVAKALRPSGAPAFEREDLAALRERLACAGFGAIPAEDLRQWVEAKGLTGRLGRMLKR
jgi:hypothetical protein